MHIEIYRRRPDVEAIVQRAREKFPGEHPRIITDNGPQFVSKDFKQFIRICGMTHVRDRCIRGVLRPLVVWSVCHFTTGGWKWPERTVLRRSCVGGSL